MVRAAAAVGTVIGYVRDSLARAGVAPDGLRDEVAVVLLFQLCAGMVPYTRRDLQIAGHVRQRTLDVVRERDDLHARNPDLGFSDHPRIRQLRLDAAELLPILQAVVSASLDKASTPDVPSVSGALQIIDGRVHRRDSPIHPLEEADIDDVSE